MKTGHEGGVRIVDLSETYAPEIMGRTIYFLCVSAGIASEGVGVVRSMAISLQRVFMSSVRRASRCHDEFTTRRTL